MIAGRGKGNKFTPFASAMQRRHFRVVTSCCYSPALPQRSGAQPGP
jgi:hypothetical protein